MTAVEEKKCCRKESGAPERVSFRVSGKSPRDKVGSQLPLKSEQWSERRFILEGANTAQTVWAIFGRQERYKDMGLPAFIGVSKFHRLMSRTGTPTVKCYSRYLAHGKRQATRTRRIGKDCLFQTGAGPAESPPKAEHPTQVLLLSESRHKPLGRAELMHTWRCFLRGANQGWKSNAFCFGNQVHNLNSLLWAPSLAVGWCNKQAELQKQKCQTEHYMEDLLNFPCFSCFGKGVSIARNWPTVHFLTIAGLGTTSRCLWGAIQHVNVWHWGSRSSRRQLIRHLGPWLVQISSCRYPQSVSLSVACPSVSEGMCLLCKILIHPKASLALTFKYLASFLLYFSIFTVNCF